MAMLNNQMVEILNMDEFTNKKRDFTCFGDERLTFLMSKNHKRNLGDFRSVDELIPYRYPLVI